MHEWPESRSQCASRDVKRTSLAVSGVPEAQSTTQSSPLRRLRCRRKLSRTIRFIRLRSTARGAHFREIAKPSRSVPTRLGRAMTAKNASRETSGLLNTSRNSEGLSSLADLGKCAPGYANVEAILGRQTGPSFSPSCLEYLATVSSLHPGSESVRSCSAEVAGLKCSFHDGHLGQTRK